MDEAQHEVAYLIFDVEAIADGELIARVRYPNEGLRAAEAIARYRAELIEKKGNDVNPQHVHAADLGGDRQSGRRLPAV